MLLSIIISLTALSSVPILGTLGRPIQAWWLNQMMQHDPQLARSLHDDHGTKPYTVSTLLNRRGHPYQTGDWLKEGQSCWLRVTSFDEKISEIFLRHLLKKLPKGLSLYKMDFRIDGYTFNAHEHPWAGQSSYAEMAQVSQYATASRDARMEFVSPTAFRNNRNDIALPIPGQVFRSLAERWNAFCPESMQLQEMWPDFANDCILVSELTSVNTVHWEFSQGTRGAATGFTGTVGFTLLPRSKVKIAWQPYWEGADVVIQSLARFAFFCGVGHHTTIGMGQARLIQGGGASRSVPSGRALSTR